MYRITRDAGVQDRMLWFDCSMDARTCAPLPGITSIRGACQRNNFHCCRRRIQRSNKPHVYDDDCSFEDMIDCFIMGRCSTRTNKECSREFCWTRKSGSDFSGGRPSTIWEQGCKARLREAAFAKALWKGREVKPGDVGVRCGRRRSNSRIPTCG